ncbi:hypothetical protein B0H34DRAFT_757412 [Crassisporium funariophilum]|nr:hypothetical protein B0H34DRAFT_757412 [Crassisporium funariophilum]
MYGRNRQSIADIEQELHGIFARHPDSHVNEEGEPVIPADALVDVFATFSDIYGGAPLLSDEEIVMFKDLISKNPDLICTPNFIIQFIAQKTKASESEQNEEDERGRDEQPYRGSHSRSSSNESSGTSYYQNPHSRPPSRGPQTPGMKSPLDSERRQRSTPLGAAAPSSWATKRPAPHRRKSDAGSRSDSESHTSPSAYGRRTGSRTRAPSNPTSPSTSNGDLNSFAPGSPPFGGTISRPHSRAHSQPQSAFNNSFDLDYSSPDDTNNYTVKRPHSRYGYDTFDNDVSSLPMPHPDGTDSDDEDEIDAGLIMDRSTASSTVSMEVHDRLDALQRNNAELGRKLMEAERALQRTLEEHETALEANQTQLETLRSELAASNRDEKDLRSKDSRNMAQISALEAEVAKVTKALEHARATYTSLQRQYQEQCSASERYRDELRSKEEIIRSLKEAATVHEVEAMKWLKEHSSYEERIAALETEISVTMEVQVFLDEQKQENMLLKETIDRMRFDMDEMRNAATNVVGGGSSGHSSAMNSMSKSLGAELLGKMKFMEPDEDTEDDESETSTAVDMDDDDTEGEEEDVIQTIITKRKRKVASRAQVIETRRTFEELKEYSDGATQYDPTLFAVNHGMQTDAEPRIIKASFSIQTDEIPEPKPIPAPLPRITMEMEIQTEEQEEEPSRSPSPQHMESMASSSSTVVPPTPKPLSKELDHEHADQPPAYNQITEHDREEREWRVAAETLKKWHNGVKIPFEAVAGGISEEAIEEWKALKQELGVECMVIDKIVASSDKIASGSRLSVKDGKATARRGGRFYNIYNTYVYGDKTTSSFTSGIAGQAIMVVGASALVILAVTPYMVPHYSVPGGATYYDRSAWNSFNSLQAGGEGFGPDGTAAVWNFLGRVGGGAARIARGWPT